jgi:hypothetical protein
LNPSLIIGLGGYRLIPRYNIIIGAGCGIWREAIR